MRITHCFLRSLAVSFGLWGGLGSSVCHAVSYLVTLDTTPLATQPTPPAPFSLAFQFDDGFFTESNTVTLSHFNFGPGGGPLGSPLTSPGASGSLAGTVTLTDSSPAEFLQEFTPSATGPLRFLLDITDNVEPIILPDVFSFAIVDSSQTGIPPFHLVGLPAEFNEAFGQIQITSPFFIDTAGTDPNPDGPPGCPTCPPIALSAPTVELATTPEPGTLVLWLSGILGLLAIHRHKHG